MEAGFAKIWVWDAGFFHLFVENSGNRHDPNKRSSSQSRNPCSLVNIYLTETVREYFVSTRCHKSPCGVIDSMLN